MWMKQIVCGHQTNIGLLLPFILGRSWFPQRSKKDIPLISQQRVGKKLSHTKQHTQVLMVNLAIQEIQWQDVDR